MALSIEFGIARTYALGVCFYVVCAVMIVASRQASRADVPAAGSVDEPGSLRQQDLTPEATAIAPSIQPTPAELAANIPTRKQLKSSIVPARAD